MNNGKITPLKGELLISSNNNVLHYRSASILEVYAISIHIHLAFSGVAPSDCPPKAKGLRQQSEWRQLQKKAKVIMD